MTSLVFGIEGLETWKNAELCLKPQEQGFEKFSSNSY